MYKNYYYILLLQKNNYQNKSPLASTKQYNTKSNNIIDSSTDFDDFDNDNKKQQKSIPLPTPGPFASTGKFAAPGSNPKPSAPSPLPQSKPVNNDPKEIQTDDFNNNNKNGEENNNEDDDSINFDDDDLDISFIIINNILEFFNSFFTF